MASPSVQDLPLLHYFKCPYVIKYRNLELVILNSPTVISHLQEVEATVVLLSCFDEKS